MKNSILRRSLLRASSTACAALLFSTAFTSCSDDLLVGQPSWLGSSIYAELEERGNFQTTLELINSLKTADGQPDDQASVLKKTGSVTLFVADDQAWQQFFANNPWGARKISDLTDAQQRLLYKGNKIKSAYLIELLGDIPSASATSDPIEGACMRRASGVELLDSVPIVKNAEFPVVNTARKDQKTGEQIDWWSQVRGKDQIILMQDDNVASMIHFMPRFTKTNNITDDDVAFMTNGALTSREDAFINGVKIREDEGGVQNQNITCQNGYIHVLDKVAVPLDNMANIISGNPQFSIYKRLLDRFSYPHYDATLSREYQRVYGGEDSVFVKRYFNSYQTNGFTQTDQKVTVSTQLPFDPGWNRYSLYSAGGQTTYQYDAAVMLVPTDEAMLAYLDGEGSDLKVRYGAGDGPTAWDNAPDEVVLPLLQNTMLTSLKSAIPSQFGSINNTAAETMGVSKSDIDQTLWACNGVIYQTNKVYVAPEYVSVFYPCVIRANDDLNLTYTVVTNDNKVSGGKGFYAYLNNMGSDYSFIIPTDKALQTYYDPVSYKRTNNTNQSTAVAYKFNLNDAGYIAASAPLVDWSTLDEKGRGQITSTLYPTMPSTATNSSGDVFNHFDDILNSSLSVGLFTPGQKFYQAKNGGPIVVEWDGNKVTGVAGSFQYERGYYIPVTETVDKSGEGNGRSYIVDEEPMMSTFTSPYAALTSESNADKFGQFAGLMLDAQLFSTSDGASHTTMDSCLTCMNNYHYTIYVPQNSSIQALKDAHKLPTGDDIDVASTALIQIQEKTDALMDDPDANADALAELHADSLYLAAQIDHMNSVLQDFVNYHIQDNSVYVDGKEYQNGVFETACLDTLTTRFHKVYVNYQRGGQLKVTDNVGNVRTVSSADGCHNVLTRQYYFNGSNLKGTSCTQIYSSSFCVIHQIDEPLQPTTHCYYDPEDYQKVMALVVKYPVENGSGDSPVKNYKR